MPYYCIANLPAFNTLSFRRASNYRGGTALGIKVQHAYLVWDFERWIRGPHLLQFCEVTSKKLITSDTLVQKRKDFGKYKCIDANLNITDLVLKYW